MEKQTVTFVELKEEDLLAFVLQELGDKGKDLDSTDVLVVNLKKMQHLESLPDLAYAQAAAIHDQDDTKGEAGVTANYRILLAVRNSNA